MHKELLRVLLPVGGELGVTTPNHSFEHMRCNTILFLTSKRITKVLTNACDYGVLLETCRVFVLILLQRFNCMLSFHCMAVKVHVVIE